MTWRLTGLSIRRSLYQAAREGSDPFLGLGENPFPTHILVPRPSTGRMGFPACSPSAKNPPEGARPAVLGEIPPGLSPDCLLLRLIHSRWDQQANVGVRQGQALEYSPSLGGLNLGILRQVPQFKTELPTLGSTCAELGWCPEPTPQKTPSAGSGRCVCRPALVED